MTKPTFSAAAGRDPADSICCWGRCGKTIADDAPVPLCREHHFRAWFAWQQTEVDALHAASDARNALLRAKAALTERVYFARFGDRVKIGYTADITQRLKAIPHDQLLAVIPGGRDEERRVHAAFAHLRITGEWFHAGNDLIRFCDAARAVNPDTP